ncbi:MAG: hypothetical protein HeimC3_48360 [Candidatus Heimdallarchaeota archaeon LC_3]|nr:MAG: hypothetical protein HeimC3_48360 [Candidatus Heimdallarchaeota archaeon LC_3]
MEFPSEIKYFTYELDPDANLMESPDYYSYGLGNLTFLDLFASLFANDEASSPPQEQLIQDYIINHQNASFTDFIQDLQQAANQQSNRVRVENGTGTFQPGTVRVVLNRINTFLNRSRHII